MKPIPREAEMPPRDYADQFEQWMEPPEKPRSTSVLIITIVALTVAFLGVATAIASLAINLQSGT